MAERVLAQMAVAFLLGVWGYSYQNCLVLVCWIGYLGWLMLTWRGQWKRRPGFSGQKRADRRLAGAFIILRLAVCLLCLGLGYGRHQQHQALAEKVSQMLEGEDVLSVSGVIDRKEEKNETIIYHLKDSFIYLKGRIPCGRILIYHDADAYSIGDTIQVTGNKIKLNKARNEGNFDETSYEHARGVLCKVKAEKIRLVRRQRILWKEALYRLQGRTAQVYHRHLSPKSAGVMSLMALGKKAGLDPQIKELYQESGVSHVLAISGLHISLLGMGIYRFLRRRGVSYGISGGAAGVIVVGFGQCCGMGLSAQRAVVMFLVMLLGNALGMAYDSVTALSLAAVFQLWEYPGSLWQAGFLFSYGAVLAVVVVTKALKEFWHCQKRYLGYHMKKDRSGEESDLRNKRKIRMRQGGPSLWDKGRRAFEDMALVSGCIQLVTLPVSAYFYYEVPVYGLFANLLLLPVMGALLGMGLLGGLLGLWSDALAIIFLKPVELLLGWNAWICGKIKSLPNALWITGRPDGGWMAAYYVCLAVALYGMSRWTNREIAKQKQDQKNGKGAPEGTEPTLRRRLSGLAASWLMLLWLPGAMVFLLAAAGEKETAQVCFLDVGQGDGVFFQGEGAVFFLDGGSTDESGVGTYRILPFLKYRGIDSVDGWFVSHGDQDHISGLKEVWEGGYRVKCLFLAEGMVRDEAWQELCQQAQRHGTRICYLSPGAAVGTSSLRLTCLYPWGKGEDRNEASMVLKMEVWEQRNQQWMAAGIFAGDIGEAQEKWLVKQYPDLRANLYKASHHGSNGSNCRELLEKLRPKITVVSCGEGNYYGHPGKEAVERMESCGSRIWYTKDSGQITISFKDGGLWVEEFLSDKSRRFP